MSNAFIGGGNSATISSTLTDNGIVIGQGDRTLAATAAMTDGQLLTGITSGPPIPLTTAMLPVQNGWVRNLSASISGGVLTLHSADGTALSASNPGFVVLRSYASTSLVVHKLTSNLTVTASDMTGMLFGMTTTISWPFARPVYFGFVADQNDANPRLFVSLVPAKRLTASSTAGIFQPGTVGAGRQSSVFLGTAGTIADYVNCPVCTFGNFRATTNVSDEWTFTAFGTAEGMGLFNSGRFQMVQGQYGAAANNYLQDNGGTAPSFTTQLYYYNIYKDGRVECFIRMNADAGTDGSGAVSSQMILPVRIGPSGNANPFAFIGYGNCSSVGGGVQAIGAYSITDNALEFNMMEFGTGADVQNGDFTNGARYINLRVSYDAEVYN